jgi:hypothetical protein
MSDQPSRPDEVYVARTGERLRVTAGGKATQTDNYWATRRDLDKLERDLAAAQKKIPSWWQMLLLILAWYGFGVWVGTQI